MPNHIQLADLNELRFSLRPQPMSTLRYRARKGFLPGAFLLGGSWMVDLDVFDAAILEQTCPGALSAKSSSDQLDQAADDILQKLEYKKAS